MYKPNFLSLIALLLAQNFKFCVGIDGMFDTVLGSFDPAGKKGGGNTQAGVFANVQNASGAGLNSMNFSPLDFSKNKQEVIEEEESSPTELRAEVCELGVDPGSCDGSEVKYFFDARRNKCRRFRYSGCGGNGNSFSTKRSCKRACKNKKSHRVEVIEEPEPVVEQRHDHHHN